MHPQIVILQLPVVKGFTGQTNVLNSSPTQTEHSIQSAAMGKTSQGCGAAIQRTESDTEASVPLYVSVWSCMRLSAVE